MKKTALLLTLAFAFSSALRAKDSLVQQFQNPPEETKPWCYWYWYKSDISREGITKDLEAMKKAGIRLAMIGKISMDVTIPANTTATVFVPAKDAAGVTESGKPAGEVEGVKFLRMESNAAVYAVGSGTYQFQSTLNKTLQ
jgi:hypothetical protein